MLPFRFRSLWQQKLNQMKKTILLLMAVGMISLTSCWDFNRDKNNLTK